MCVVVSVDDLWTEAPSRTHLVPVAPRPLPDLRGRDLGFVRRSTAEVVPVDGCRERVDGLVELRLLFGRRMVGLGVVALGRVFFAPAGRFDGALLCLFGPRERLRRVRGRASSPGAPTATPSRPRGRGSTRTRAPARTTTRAARGRAGGGCRCPTARVRGTGPRRTRPRGVHLRQRGRPCRSGRRRPGVTA